ncbi:aldo/keto reductase [Salinimicrobium sp. GXAS 041]|uniref:aldo/keto reductase n=1 Tax=Salinimicrobium sp. GXAS 041 TaxID=3400806 RepID=UPI003C7839C7
MRKKNTYSRIIQNVFNWGTAQETFQKGKMIHLLHSCVENDITSFDACSENGETVKKTFGTALSESGLSRDEIQLIGKFKNHTEKDLITQVDGLLLNMRTDYLDLLLLEAPQQPETLRNDLEKLSSQGKISEVGGFNLQAQEITAFKEHFSLSANYSEFNFSASEEKNGQSQEFSEEIVQMIEFDPKKIDRIVENDIFKQLSEKYHCDKGHLLLSWLLNHPSHLHPVISFDSEEEIARAVKSKEVSFDPVDWQKINFLLK